MNIRLLTRDDLVRCGISDVELVLRTVEKVLHAHANGLTDVPAKTVIHVLEGNASRGRFNCMPAQIRGDFGRAGVKWLSRFARSPSQAAGGTSSAVLTILSDLDTGVPLAIVEGGLISSMRTGAVNGLAIRELATRGARGIAVIGAGAVNSASILAANSVLPSLETVWIVDKDPIQRDSLAREVRGLGLRAVISAAPAEAARAADVILLATGCGEPLIDETDLTPGVLVCEAGPNEVTGSVVKAADKIVVDNWDGVMHRGVHALARLAADHDFRLDETPAEFGDILVGNRPGRQSQSEVILFCPVGMAIEDIAVADAALRVATARNIGVEWSPLAAAV